MDILQVHLFKTSFKPFLELLNEHDVKYQMQAHRSGPQAAASGVVEIVQALGSLTIWPSLATVIVAFIKSRDTRKIIITTKDNTVVHAEGLSMKEIEQVLKHTKNMTVIDTQPSETQNIDGE